MLIGCHRSVAPVKDADVAGLVPSWCATSHRRQRRRRHQPRRRRQATLGFDRPQDSNATGVPDDSATPLVSESVLGVFLGSPAATPRLESETPVAFDLRSTEEEFHATGRCGRRGSRRWCGGAQAIRWTGLMITIPWPHRRMIRHAPSTSQSASVRI